MYDLLDDGLNIDLDFSKAHLYKRDLSHICRFLQPYLFCFPFVGEVKEKEQAHKEYKEAISKGHGAYLMDEETPVSCTSLSVTSQVV